MKRAPSGISFFAYAVAAILVAGCSPAVQHIKYEASLRAPKASDCHPDVYERGVAVERPYELIGEVWIHDTGFSVDCGRDVVRATMRERACETGADGIVVAKESFPHPLGSTCYRVKAYFIAYAETDGDFDAATLP